jgi:hypothetical protein
MDEVVKQKWIEALRSGEYEQGKAALNHMNKRFCCLGVLGDLYAKETGEQWSNAGGGEYALNEEAYFLPPSVVKWAGLEDDNPALPKLPRGFPKTCRLAALNDNGESFSRIADLIEKYL